MILGIHPDIKGKPEKIEREGLGPLYRCNGKIINQGYGWMNVEVDSWRDAFELITVDGYATSSELSCDHRNEENYVSRQICMVDIDDGMTIQELFQDNFYNEFGAGFYTTAQHTDEAHRFRIMFVLEEPEKDPLVMRKIIRGLLEQYKTGDTNCTDASRIYYGIPNCPYTEFNDKVLPKVAVEVLVELIDKQDKLKEEKTQKEFQQYKTITKYDIPFVDALLSRIAQKEGTLKGEYNTWTKIAWATVDTIGMHEANQLLMKYWPTKTKKEINSLKDWKSDRTPGVGTLIKMSGISKDSLLQLETDFRIRNNVEIILSPEQAVRALKKKIKIY